MNTNDYTRRVDVGSAREHYIATLADSFVALMDAGNPVVEPFDLLEAFAALLDKATFYAVCERLDLCPIHAEDIEICMDDDDPECRDYRRELLGSELLPYVPGPGGRPVSSGE